MCLSVLQDFKQRGVGDIFIACIDGLKGFSEAIESVFPTTQIHIVYQIRGSLRFIPGKHLKEFIVDLKAVYQTNTREIGDGNLLLLVEKWGKLYPKAVESWVNNWGNLSIFFNILSPSEGLSIPPILLKHIIARYEKLPKLKVLLPPTILY